jgi:small-conductance mechanosensitive channel
VAMFGFAAVGMPAVLFVAIAAAWWGFQRTKSWLMGSLVLYAVWFVLAFGMAWLVARIMGGASMAVVENVADAGAMRRGALEMAGVMLLFAQVIIVPWVMGAGWLLRRVVFRTTLQ